MNCSIYCLAVLEAVLPVAGSRYPLISYVFTFPKHWHRFLQGEARPVLGLTTSRKSSRGRFEEVGAAQRSVQMAPNFADMWKGPG
jgi:hypothetical protein